MPDRVVEVLLVVDRLLPHCLGIYHKLIKPELLKLPLLDHQLCLIVLQLLSYPLDLLLEVLLHFVLLGRQKLVHLKLAV